MFAEKASLIARLLTIFVLLALVVPPSTAAGPPGDDPQGKVEAVLLEELAQNGQATFWVLLHEEADLSPAHGMVDWEARGRFVFEQLQATAATSQTSLVGLLQGRGVPHRSFWIVNALRVTADRATLDELSARPEVAQIVADGEAPLPKVLPAQEQPSVRGTEWNIDRIRAPEVWSDLGVRGEGIVVANIDGGVQYDHPALVRQYRGRRADGSFSHNYNWFDPSKVCGNPSLAPCDDNGHGTHTMGTMVGDDAADPLSSRIGVAPGATWIAARGCEERTCSYTALVASGQWVLAPTALNGRNPRPELRPHVVNNSWGGGSGRPFYQRILRAWVAAGIFPAFANGNNGPGCATSGSPGDNADSYSAGAFDRENHIADYSSRGASAFGGITKPNIAAPGSDVRSAVNGGGYATLSGTSMASPHVAGTVALLWSANPALVGDIATTRALLDRTAIDTPDTACGGTATNNNVWGEGRLDARAAVEQARCLQCTIQGVVTDGETGAATGEALVQATGPTTRTATTDANGQYRLLVPPGRYSVTAKAFGYRPRTLTGVVVTDGETRNANLTLAPKPAYAISGVVRRSDGAPITNATVTILGVPIPPTTTDAAGSYSFARVPEGTYTLRVEAGGCAFPQTKRLAVNADQSFSPTLRPREDNGGYRCQQARYNFIAANTVLPLRGDENSVPVRLPFAFPFYGRSYNTAQVSTNGFLTFLQGASGAANRPIPSADELDGAIYVFWADLNVDASASVRTESLGTAPNRQFVIEWRNVGFFDDLSRRLTFEVILHESGQIVMQYTQIGSDERKQGSAATIGLENEAGTVALQFSHATQIIRDNMAVRYLQKADDWANFFRYDEWRGVDDLAASNASYRATTAAGQTIHYRTSPTTAVTLISYRGPDQGQAQILIDGQDKGILDLYAPVAEYQHLAVFDGLPLKRHRIAVKPLGQKNPLSSGTEVRVDGFQVGGTTIENSSRGVQYTSWVGASNANAYGGSYRRSTTRDATVSFRVAGPRFTWITARGPALGKAQVSVDGVTVATVDLYDPTQQWRVPIVIRGLTAGTHEVQIKVLRERNPTSSGYAVVLDAVSVP